MTHEPHSEHHPDPLPADVASELHRLDEAVAAVLRHDSKIPAGMADRIYAASLHDLPAPAPLIMTRPPVLARLSGWVAIAAGLGLAFVFGVRALQPTPVLPGPGEGAVVVAQPTGPTVAAVTGFDAVGALEEFLGDEAEGPENDELSLLLGTVAIDLTSDFQALDASLADF